MRDLDRLAVATLALAVEAVREDAAPWLAANERHRRHFARTGQWVPTEEVAA